MKPKILFLVGPTAVGKTEISVKLAKKLNAEIISCDSMQVYKGMGIISSQAPASLRKKVPHHLIGIITPAREYNVSLFRKTATKKIKEIIARRKIPIFVGGTGLYMSILINGIFKAKQGNKAVRKRLYQEANLYGNQYLYDKLKTIDPQAASKIHLNDTKRIVRALEVFETTGKPISYLQKQRKGLTDKYDVRTFCLNMQRDKLYTRIEERVEGMFRKGLLKEVQKLVKSRLSKTASFAIGIRELKGYFSGEYDLDETKSLIKRNTRLYAKRQLTWFRKDKRIKWIEIDDEEKPNETANRILKDIFLR